MQIVRTWLKQSDRQGRFVATLLVLLCLVLRRTAAGVPIVNWTSLVDLVQRRGVRSIDEILMVAAAVNTGLQGMLQPFVEVGIMLVLASVIAMIWWPGMRISVLRSSQKHA